MVIKKSDWMQTWVSLIHAGTFLKQGLERALREELGISLAEQDLIKQLHVNSGQLLLSELGERIYFSKAGITRMVDRLEKSGLVRRRAVQGDRRALTAELTRKGEAVFAKSRVVLEHFVRRHLRDRLDDGDLLNLKSGLEALLRAHNVWEGQQRHLAGGK